jgi:uncharacterized membrane protein YhaH (DUF805 family)
MSASSPHAHRGWLTRSFSFKGRATRREYWLQVLVSVLLVFVAGVIITRSMLLTHHWLVSHGRPGASAVIWAGILLLLADFLLFAWSLFAVDSRRSHDLGRPFFGGIADTFSLRGLTTSGTAGPNQYGPDPSQEAAQTE